MLKKLIAILLVSTVATLSSGVAHAASGQDKGETSLTRGAASLLLPGWGQYLNGEMKTRGGKIKTGTMIALEIGGALTTILVGTLVGYPVIWAGIGILIFNHLWSATDAYVKAPVGPEMAMKGESLER
ncbi:MAG TPA: hypothetical protein PLH16_04035 [Candidatus Omnitrophota bacterium]|jgi:hypothetical protein|nr:hypothetical protein [Candidatus Omnitrophota bacterium]